MSVILSPVGGAAAQFFDNNGVILSGGKIYTYSAGTTTNQTTYTNYAGVTAHTNPIILDSAGRVPGGQIWLNTDVNYKFVVRTSAEVLIATYDNIPSAAVANYTVRIPTDYPTLQAAFTALAPGSFKSGQYFDVLIEAGHSLTSGLVLEFGNFSNFKISSEDAVVNLNQSVFPQRGTVISGTQTVLPTLNCLIDCENWGGIGLEVGFNSDAVVSVGCGIKNVGDGTQTSDNPSSGTGLRITHDSRVVCSGAVFSGCSYRNVWLTRNSMMTSDSADFTFGSEFGDYALFVSRGCIMHGNNMNVSNSYHGALRVGRSYVSCRLSNFNDAGTIGITSIESSIISAVGCTINNSGGNAVEAQSTGGGEINLTDATIDNAGSNGIYARNTKVIANSATITNATANAVFADSGEVLVLSANLSNAGESAIYCRDGIVRASDRQQSGSPGVNATGAGFAGINCERGGLVTAKDINITNTGDYGIYCINGTVIATNATITSATERSIYGENANITFTSGVISTSGKDSVYVEGNSNVCLDDSTINANVTGYQINCKESVISCVGATIRNSAASGIRAENVSKVCARSATITGSAVEDVDILTGSVVDLNGATTTNSASAGVPNITNTNQANFNVLTASGTIFYG